MRKILSLICSLAILKLFAQTNIHRTYTQTPVGNGMYFNCEMHLPVKTADKGYVFAFNPWSPNIHSAYPIDNYLIKTDSNFIPQWRKPYFSKAIPLPTGGIILYFNVGTYDVNGFQNTYVEKVTASGAQVWIKMINANIRINGGVQYGNKIRLVGGKLATAGFYPLNYTTSQPYTIELDTMGLVTSQSLYVASFGASTEFAGIKRDASGNFFVLGGFNAMVLAKFNPSFSLVWAKFYSNSQQPLFLTDIDVLPNGRIIATGLCRGSSLYNYAGTGILAKLDSQGNLLAQKYINRRYMISGLCKKPNGNYAVTINSRSVYQDSLFIFETDTALNISGFNLLNKGISAGTPIAKDNGLCVPVFAYHPFLTGTALDGSNCMTSTAAFTSVNYGAQLAPFSMSASAATFAFNTATYSVLQPQSYVDSCKCGPTISPGNTSVCAGAPASVQATGIGPITWYATATGSVPLSSGSTYSYSSSSPTLVTTYAQDGACVSLVRVPVTITVNPKPQISITVFSATVCAGATASIYAQGATSYTWNTGAGTPSFTTQPLNHAVVYSVTGTNNYGCANIQTTSVMVYPNPTLSISGSNSFICAGGTATFNVSGAASYIWSNSVSDSSIVVSPSATAMYSVSGTTNYGCVRIQTITLLVHPNPVLSVSSSHFLMCTGNTATLTAVGANSYTWSNSLSGNSITISPLNTMSYSVYGLSQFGCSGQASTQQYVQYCTGLTDIKQRLHDVSVFPNPASDFVQLVATETELFEIELYNSLGQLITIEMIKGLTNIDLSHYAAGIYYLKVEKNEAFKLIKIVKE